MEIRFGTDGWRAIIADQFTFHNVRLVSQAIADMLTSDSEGRPTDGSPSVAVGYDVRFLSDRFAAEASAVLAANGVNVYLASAPCPTPVLAHAVRQIGASGGIMITASHNPPEFNGLKWKDGTGGPGPKGQTCRIETHLERNVREARAPRHLNWRPGKEDYPGGDGTGFIRHFDPMPEYVAHIRNLVDMDSIARWKPRVLVDPMHGAGCGLLQGLLHDIGLKADEIHGRPDSLFGGLCPEPIARNLHDLSCGVVRGHYDVGLALDGDGDRIGAVDEAGQFVDPHRIFSLALLHLVENKGQRGAVVKTVSTTQMINRICKEWDLPVYETPVGFNHICEIMRSEDVLICGEESGGITIRGHVPDGDGILMALMLLEIMAAHKSPLGQLVKRLADRFGPLYYERRDVAMEVPCGKAELVRRLMDEMPQVLGGVAVSHGSSTDGAKLCLSDGSWLLIRPSGTEPVLRIYAEAPSSSQVEALLSEGLSLVQNHLGIRIHSAVARAVEGA